MPRYIVSLVSKPYKPNDFKGTADAPLRMRRQK